ncbi:hypothetical protein [Methanobrevibacter filiformis]|uniref:Uncharacterized protein n=1 Tax=Methanobrevibacter filiformis TaxID=55758 RepID=A0A166FAN2_9EURY|nr:hypothetical protein [Methanobrevibacter filiformis]KZX17474.1 hypothetical protein MBFIL_01320 [Methanobrevibacter filiformis]
MAISNNMIEIIIKAIDKASEVAENISDNFKKSGDVAKKSFEDANKSIKNTGDVAQKSFDNANKSIKGTSDTIKQTGIDSRSTFMQIQYGANSSLSNVNRNLSSVKSTGNSTWSSIKSSAGSAWSNIKSGASSMASSISQSFSSMKSNASGFMDSLDGVQGLMAGALGGMGVNAVSDIVVNTSAKAETNKILLKNMTSTSAGAEKLYNTIDNATNKTLVSMQQVIPAINAFKASTGANEKTLNTVSPKVAQFGSYVYALTGSAAQAEGAMFDLSKGIKGAYASLDQYGITEASLMKTGLWSGKEDDVEGYMNAVNKVTGSTDELMGTFTGLQATMTKMFSIAGKKIGQYVLPVLKTMIEGFMALDKTLGGNLTLGLLVAVGALGLLLTAGVAVNTLWPILTSGAGLFGKTLTGLKGIIRSTAVETEILNEAMGKAGEALPDGNGKDKGGKAPKGKGKIPKLDAVSFKDTIKGDLKNIGRGTVAAAAGIAAGMALATEALILMQGPMWALGELGNSYNKNKTNILAGAEAFKTVGIVLALILPPIIAFAYIMGTAGGGSFQTLAMGSLAAAAGIAIGIALATEAIYLLKVPLWAIGELGSDFNKNKTNVEAGLKVFKLVSDTLIQAAPFIIIFAAAVALFGTVPVAGLMAAAGIVITIGLATEAIILLEEPLNKISDLGEKFSDLGKVKQGAETIKQAAIALTSLSEALNSANNAAKNKISLSVINELAGWFGGFTAGGGVFSSLTKGIKDLDVFIDKLNSINIPTVPTEITNKLKSLAETIKAVSSIFNSMKTAIGDGGDTGFENWKFNLFNGNGSEIAENLSKLIDDSVNLVKKIQEKAERIPAIPKGISDKLKSMAEIVKSISEIMKTMKTAIDSGADLTYSNRVSNGRTGYLDNIVKQIDGIIIMTNTLKTKMARVDQKGISGIGTKFRLLTNELNYFLNDIIKGNESFKKILNLKSGENLEKATPQINKTVDGIITFINATKPKMERVNADSISGIGEKWRLLSSEFGYFINDAVSISQKMAGLAKIKVEYVAFSQLENTISNVISSIGRLKTLIPEDLDVAGLGERWRALSSEFGYFLNDYIRINQSFANMPEDPIPPEKFTNMENAIKTIITSLKNIQSAVGTDEGSNLDAEGLSSAITTVTSTITQINSVLSAASGVQPAAQNLGSKITTGIKLGAVNVGSATVTIIGTAISAIQNRYATFQSAGTTAAQKFVAGLRTGLAPASQTMVTEIAQIISAIQSRYTTAYSAGYTLGQNFAKGYKSGADVNSPGLAARTTAEEIGYILSAITAGFTPAYRAGATLGGNFASGYGTPVLPSIGNVFEDSELNLNSLLKLLKTNNKDTKTVKNNIQVYIKIDRVSNEEDIQELEYRLEAVIDNILKRKK